MSKKSKKSPVSVSRVFLKENKTRVRRGDSVEAIVDEFVMTDVNDITNVAEHGEEIAAKAFGGRNLNVIMKNPRFPFADVIVGDFENLEDAELLSVKCSSVLFLKDGKLNTSAVLKNSPVDLGKINTLFKNKSNRGLKDVFLDKLPKKIKLGVVTVQPTLFRKRGRVFNINNFDIGKKGLVHVGVKKYTKTFNLDYKIDRDKEGNIVDKIYLSDDSGIVRFNGKLESHESVQNFFSDTPITKLFPTEARLSHEYLNAHAEDNIDDPLSLSSGTKERQDLLRSFRNNLRYLRNDQLKIIIDKIESMKKEEDFDLREAIAKNILSDLKELILERKKKSPRSKCIPARRRINSGGKAGSYADPRTGGKQAYAALKAAKPPGSRGGWTKKKCICCHKCPNDRSAPNGFVCTNPSHLYWGTKADNTYDQNRGNGWAARNKNKNEGDPNGEKAFAYELMISEDKIKSLVRKILKEDAASDAWFGESFVKFKNAVNSGKDPLKYAKDNLVEVGRGSTRVVFDLPDNSGYVLKIINTEVEKTDQSFVDARGNIMPDIGPEGDRRTKHGFFKSHMRQSNQWEADLVMQQKYPNVFPKTFEYADDFSWILSEKAKTLPAGRNDIDNLFDLLGVKRSNFDKQKSRAQKKRELLNLINDAMQYFKNPEHRLRQLNEAPPTFAITDFMKPGDTIVHGDTTAADEISKKYINNNSSGVSISKEDQQLKDLLTDSHNRQVISAMLDLNIPAREFLPKNLGISEITGKLLIIDASLWSEHKPVRE